MTLPEAIRLRIQELCREKNITLNNFQLYVKSQFTINNIMSRESTNPTVSTIKKICDGLDMTLGEFFDSECFSSLEQKIQ